MISALKITADRIAERGVWRSMTLSFPSTLRLAKPANIAGMIAKYFATSFAIENVVSEPRVIRSCLPISTMSMSLVGSESRSTMFPASLAAWVPVFIATPTSACASAGASFVPSPVIATRRPPCCSRLISSILSSGVASARKSSTPASLAMTGGGARVVAGDHHRADAHAAQVLEALGDAGLDDVLEVDHPERAVRRPCSLPRWAPRPRRAACRPARRSSRPPRRARPVTVPPCSSTQRRTESAAPLRTARPSKSTPLMRVCAVNGMSSAPSELALAQAVLVLGEHDDRAALRASRRRGSRAARRRPAPARSRRSPG